MFCYSLFYFSYKTGCPKKWFIWWLVSGQVTASSLLFFNIHACSMRKIMVWLSADQSSKYSESHLVTPCISVSFLVQKVMGGGRLIGAHQPSPRTLLVIKFGEFTWNFHNARHRDLYFTFDVYFHKTWHYDLYFTNLMIFILCMFFRNTRANFHNEWL